MSNDHAVVVDDFESGYAGVQVLGTVTPPSDSDTSAADLEEFGELVKKDEPSEPAKVEPAPVTEPAAPAEVPKTRQLSEEEYQSLMNYGKSIDELRADVARRNDQVFGKMGAMEQLIANTQKATPRGEVPKLTMTDMGALGERYEYMSADLLDVLNNTLSKLEGTGGAPATAVDQTQIAQMVNDGISAALPKLTEQAKLQIRREVEEERVLEKHADAFDIFETPGFKAFVQALPEDRRKLVASSWDSKVIVPALNDYKKSLEKPAPPATTPNQRKAALEAAVNPVGTTGGTAPKTLTDDEELEAGYRSG